jgi:hypothetical protein
VPTSLVLLARQTYALRCIAAAVWIRRCSESRCGESRCGESRCGESRCGTALCSLRCESRCGTALCSLRCESRCGTALCSLRCESRCGTALCSLRCSSSPAARQRKHSLQPTCRPGCPLPVCVFVCRSFCLSVSHVVSLDVVSASGVVVHSAAGDKRRSLARPVLGQHDVALHGHFGQRAVQAVPEARV